MWIQAISRIGGVWLTIRLLPYLVPKSLTDCMIAHEQMTKGKILRRLENKVWRKDIIGQLSRGESALSFAELQVNAATLIVAGSETTATAMAVLTYFLMLNPDKCQKVVQEIRSAFDTEDQISFATVSRLSYLGVCIDEALRIHPPVAFGVPRRVPGKGIMLNGKWVPGNVC
jgi:cytochrome P450